MPSPQVLVASKTDAETSQSFFVAHNHSVSISCTPDLVSAEEVGILISSSQEGTFAPYQDGAPVKLHAAQNAVRLYGPAYYKVDKDATVTATAVHRLA